MRGWFILWAWALAACYACPDYNHIRTSSGIGKAEAYCKIGEHLVAAECQTSSPPTYSRMVGNGWACEAGGASQVYVKIVCKEGC